MRQIARYRLLLVALLMIIWANRAAAAGPEPIVAGQSLATWYQAQTGYAPSADWFGAYALQPMGDALYIGLGTARPAEMNGSLLARWDGQALTAVGALPEQGLIDMQLANGRLWIPGPDPLDDWSLGTVYVSDGRTLIRRRTLPNVMHTWGLWRDADGRLLAAVGRHLGDNATWAGGIFASTDDGLTWTLDADPGLGAYRTYDVMRGRLGLVAVAADGYTNDCPVVIRRGDTAAWRRTGQSVVCRARLSGMRGRVLALAAGGQGLVEPLTGRRWLFDGWSAEVWAYNWFATDGQAVFVLSADGRVMASEDLVHWRSAAVFGRPLLSVVFWPGHGLVVAERGAAGGVWLVP